MALTGCHCGQSQGQRTWIPTSYAGQANHADLRSDHEHEHLKHYLQAGLQ